MTCQQNSYFLKTLYYFHLGLQEWYNFVLEILRGFFFFFFLLTLLLKYTFFGLKRYGLPKLLKSTEISSAMPWYSIWDYNEILSQLVNVRNAVSVLQKIEQPPVCTADSSSTKFPSLLIIEMVNVNHWFG